MKILSARRFKKIDFDDLKIKNFNQKAKYFITCNKDFQRQVPFYRENLKLGSLQNQNQKTNTTLIF